MMRQGKILLVAVVVLGAMAPSQAIAAKRTLTLSVNGAPIPTGGPESGDPFAIVTTGSVLISVPSAELAISCPSDPETGSFGWVQSNSEAADVVGTDGYNAGPTRECSGHEFGGLLLDGTLQFKVNGSVVMGMNQLLHHRPQLELDGCYFFGALKGKESLPGPLGFTLSGTMKSHGRGCPPAANVEVGPFQVTFESFAVDGVLAF